MKKLLLIAIAAWSTSIHSDTKLNYHDYLPISSIGYPFEFLNSDYKAECAGDLTKEISESVSLTVMTFMQNADYGYNSAGTRVPAGETLGRINLLGLTYGSRPPTGQTANSLLTAAGALTYHDIADDDSINFNNDNMTDLQQNFGFLGIPAEYRKIGTRMQLDFKCFNNFIITLQGGVCDMRQSVTGYTDMTPYTNQSSLGSDDSADLTLDKAQVYNNLTRLYKEIFDGIGINPNNWHALGIEDAKIALTWRANLPVQQESESNNWTKFVIIPHVTITGVGAFGNNKNPDILLSLPFGNNGHHALDFSTGLAFAFNETVELFVQGGMTSFSNRRYAERVPTNIYQSRVYQYKTDIKVNPSNTVHASTGINAHYFMDRLSAYVQLNYASHEKDTIELVNYDSVYKPERLARDTEWKAAVMNIGLTYDFSPNFSMGGTIQVPIHQRATYSTNTFGFGMTCTF